MLMAIQGYSELMQDELDSETPAKHYVGQILAAAGRARDLVRQILAYSRQSEPELTPVELHGVIREAVQLLRATLPTTIGIQDHLDEHTGKVMADTSQIHQVLLNLGSNASYALGEEGGVLSVSLDPVEVDQDLADELGSIGPGTYARLVVRDSGCGMDDDVMQRIFDPFFTTKGVGKGTGLGLSVVQGIVTKHAGAIQVQSELRVGTTFYLYFPLVGEAETRVSDPSAMAPGGSERVLFVDDEEQVATLAGMMLEKLGYSPTVETNSEAALQIFRAHPADFDLIIADYTMPRMTGVDLARACKEIDPGIPIMLATGFQAGITSLIAKPYRIADLAQAIRNALDGAEPRA
jgi:CheY-like chemotaxis protein